MIDKENSEFPPPSPAKAVGIERSSEMQVVNLQRQLTLAASKIQHLEQELMLKDESIARKDIVLVQKKELLVHKDELLAHNAREIRQISQQLHQVTEERDGLADDFVAKETRYLDKIVDLNSEISDSKRENTKLKSENTKLHEENTKMAAEVSKLKEKVVELQASLEEETILAETHEAAALAARSAARDTLKIPNEVLRGQKKPPNPLVLSSQNVPRVSDGTMVTGANAPDGASTPRTSALKQQSAPQTPKSTNEVDQEMMCAALRQANNHLQKEIASLKALSTRLENENEHFQVLLALSTVDGLQQRELRDRLSSKNSMNTQSPELRAAHYEILSLETQNVALRLCLERLVYRLLEEHDIGRLVKEQSSAEKLESFQRRLSSVCNRVNVQKEALHRTSRGNGIEMDWSIISSHTQPPKSEASTAPEGPDQLVIPPIRRGPDKHLTAEVVDSTSDLMSRRIRSQTELFPLHTRTQD